MFRSDKLKTFMRQEMREETVLLNQKQREIALPAIKEVCSFRGYEPLAININKSFSRSCFGSNQARKNH